MTDRSTDPKRFDPRFDPAFQPGYDARNDPAIGARAVTPIARPPRTDLVGSPPERMPPAQHRRPDPAEPTPTSEQVTETDAVPAPRGANPYTIVLWVLSVLLVAVGIALLRAIPALEQQASGATEGTSFTQMFGYASLSAVLIGTGVLVAAGNLLLLAARWRGRPAERD